jgi:hypothetical protein
VSSQYQQSCSSPVIASREAARQSIRIQRDSEKGWIATSRQVVTRDDEGVVVSFDFISMFFFVIASREATRQSIRIQRDSEKGWIATSRQVVTRDDEGVVVSFDFISMFFSSLRAAKRRGNPYRFSAIAKRDGSSQRGGGSGCDRVIAACAIGYRMFRLIVSSGIQWPNHQKSATGKRISRVSDELLKAFRDCQSLIIIVILRLCRRIALNPF